VEPAEEATVLGFQDAPTLAERFLGVIDLDPARGAADPAALDRPLTLAPVAPPDGATDLGGDVAAWVLCGSGHGSLRGGLSWRRRLLPRVLHEPAPLRGAIENEVEPHLEDLVSAGTGMGVREGVAGGLELGEEALGDVEVKAA